MFPDLPSFAGPHRLVVKVPVNPVSTVMDTNESESTFNAPPTTVRIGFTYVYKTGTVLHCCASGLILLRFRRRSRLLTGAGTLGLPSLTLLARDKGHSTDKRQRISPSPPSGWYYLPRTHPKMLMIIVTGVMGPRNSSLLEPKKLLVVLIPYIN